MAAYVDAGDMVSQYSRQDSPLDYPTPSASSDAGTVAKDEPAKKKRKAWGQPVPEIVKILPPRKRAKTAEEKEQRKNERILRNRRAADKSRQRQKAAQAGLEQQNKDLLAENAQLRALVQEHGLVFNFVPPPPSEDFSEDKEYDTPVISYPTPSSSEAASQVSPCIAPQLDASQISMPAISSSDSNLTQYPAVVLCDLQCQLVLEKKLRLLDPTSMVSTILTLIHYLTIAMTFSPSTPSPIHFLFQTLEEKLATTSSALLETIVLHNFQLLHILISMPSTPTQPAVFRLKLLSRLLACNPSLAPLLTMAADRALQQRLAEENWTADADSKWCVSSLMTIKWSIQWLDKRHRTIRMQVRNGLIDRDSLYQQEKTGVDCGAVEKHYRLFDEIDPIPQIKVTSGIGMPSSIGIEAH